MNRREKRPRIRPVVLLGIACLGLLFLPAGAIEPEPRPLDVTVCFVETTPEILAEAEAKLGFSLDPTRGRCVLTVDEQAALLGSVVGEARGRVIGKVTVALLPGVENTFKVVETVRVPKRYEVRIDPSDASGKPRVMAAEFTQREVGLTLSVHCLRNPTAGVAALSISLNASRVAGWQTIVPGIREPVIKKWGLTTTLAAPLGKTLALVNHPHEPFESSALCRTGKPAPPSVMLLLIRAE